MTEYVSRQSRWQIFLAGLERAGNRLPVRAVLFIWLCVVFLVLSRLMAALGVQAQLPGRTEPVVARSLLSAEAMRWMLTLTIDNFSSFAPVGTVRGVMVRSGRAAGAAHLRGRAGRHPF